jgi:hypothetical protein
MAIVSLLITASDYYYLLAIVSLLIMASDYYYLLAIVSLLITASDYHLSFGHCISTDYGFWLPSILPKDSSNQKP